MKATSLLEDQHRTIEALFEKLECGQGDPRATLATLANHLIAHMAVEQEIFYPAVHEVDGDFVGESFEEHALAEVALKRLLAASTDEPWFKARVTALKVLIAHHVAEEEEELFPQVEEMISSESAQEELGKRLAARFREVYETGFHAATPRGVPKTAADLAHKSFARLARKNDVKKDKLVAV